MKNMRCMCCVCQRIQEKRAWRYVPVKDEEQFTHGYCPECFQQVMRELQALVGLKYSKASQRSKGKQTQTKRGLSQGGACA
nr:hypothetical protein [uncultured Desulfobulbus sp.]